MKIRYYLHGDMHESEIQKYYCSICDSFENEEHFTSLSHINLNQDKYFTSLNHFKKSNANFLKLNTRLSKVDNLFSRIKKEKIKISRFFRWLKKQKERDDPIGDLAIDALSDQNFPKDYDSLDKIKAYLICKGACYEAIQALTEAFNEFDNMKQYRIGIFLKLRFEIFKRDNYKCCICGVSAKEDKVKLEVDHKFPVSKGGTNEETNLWTLCFNCNRGKGSNFI